MQVYLTTLIGGGAGGDDTAQATEARRGRSGERGEQVAGENAIEWEPQWGEWRLGGEKRQSEAVGGSRSAGLRNRQGGLRLVGHREKQAESAGGRLFDFPIRDSFFVVFLQLRTQFVAGHLSRRGAPLQAAKRSLLWQPAFIYGRVLCAPGAGYYGRVSVMCGFLIFLTT